MTLNSQRIITIEILLPEGCDDISITLCEEDSSVESTSIKVDDEESLISASSPRGSPTAEDSRSNFDFIVPHL